MKHIKIFENFSLNESFDKAKEIKDFVSKNSYLEFDEENDDSLVFSTRKNGDVGSEEYSPIDYKEALKIKKELEAKFDIEVEVEPVDEWVILTVKNKETKPKQPEFYYTFQKRDPDNGNGFGESFTSMDDLMNKYEDWLDIDWAEAKKKIDAINEFPEKTFNAHKINAKPFYLAKAGDKGNKWGYDFYITKTKNI